MMTMAIPLTGPDMNLDITCYCPAVDGKNSVPEVATGIIAHPSGEDYLNLRTGIGKQIRYHLPLPDTGNKFL
jgi:hypothetical protein